MPPRSVAVVGSGVAGLVAAHVASRTARVTLYEADARLGGHADTHNVVETGPDGRSRTLHIDTGFIVHNPRTYPVLLRLFAELDVATQPSEMSMSIVDDETGLQWAGARGRHGLFPRADNLRRPRYLAMLAEIPRFHRRARALLETDGDAGGGATLREFLAEGRFSAYFVRHFMEPLVACVWSCDPAVSLDYPARYLFTFLQHHGMLGIFGSPQWRTVTGGSRTYVDALAAGLTDVRLETKVTSVLETADGVEVTDGSGTTTSFDAVVIATHPSHALSMLAEPTPLQREVLAAMPYSPNTALLHTDASLLPSAEGARASWNARRLPSGGMALTYDLTRLQRLDTDVRYLVTLGGDDLVDPATVIDRMAYEHPLYNPTSVAAQARLPEIDTDRVVLAGAYHGWGFHEDGARSGLAAATRLGLPWPETAAVVAPPVRTGVYDTTINHTRRRPWRRRFTLRSHLWVVDLDDLPDHGVLARFEARDHLGDPERSIRENVTAFLARHDVEIGAGKVFMAAQARALGYCFNPISVFWCYDESGALAATVVEVHNTYGDRHAYLVHPDEHGRAQTPKAMYVSPFHGVGGDYDLVVPPPVDDRLTVVVELRTDDAVDGRARFSASLTGTRAAPSSSAPLRAAPAAVRGSLLIRAHGIWLWLRRLPVRPRPAHTQEGVR
ncbi:hypothetical protein GCM10023340_05530 [Nocardioides marinquilinus]|uniref:Amine oxidase domain-containing protein n=1 Tax=Nocardioides marinquilinus TaxID=1210400 RepID=A0ABP9P817_9ACTN